MVNDSNLTLEGYAILYLHTREGKVEVKLDPEDLIVAQEINRFVLYKDPKDRPFARADKKDKQVLLHRYLFDIPKGSTLQFINGNTLDLRRENLQFVDRSGEITLLKPPASPVVSEKPLKGVTFHKGSQKWTSRPYHGKDRYSLGYFETQKEAEAETRVFISEGPDSPNLKRNQRKGKK